MNIIEKDRERHRKIFGERNTQKEYWAHSICSICYNECAIRVKVVDGKPVAIEGVPESDRVRKGAYVPRASPASWTGTTRTGFSIPSREQTPRRVSMKTPS